MIDHIGAVDILDDIALDWAGDGQCGVRWLSGLQPVDIWMGTGIAAQNAKPAKETEPK